MFKLNFDPLKIRTKIFDPKTIYYYDKNIFFFFQNSKLIITRMAY